MDIEPEALGRPVLRRLIIDLRIINPIIYSKKFIGA
jgi:hypothetical protein